MCGGQKRWDVFLVRSAIAILATAVVCGWLGWTVWFKRSGATLAADSNGLFYADSGALPVRISKRSLKGPKHHRNEEWFRSQIQLPKKESKEPFAVSGCLHVLLYHGANADLEHESIKSGSELLDVLLNSQLSQEYFDGSILVPTPFGIRFRTFQLSALNREYELESHRDQSLATMARLGVPLNTKVVIGDEEYSMKDCLNDSIANFTISQKEITWSLDAYLLYLPPQGITNWKNRLGEAFSFDELVREVMRRPLSGGSCGGTHYVASIVLALRVQEQYPILSPETVAESGRWLEEQLKRLQLAMAEDGSVDGEWFRANRVPNFRNSRDHFYTQLVASSHWAEILQILPESYSVPERCERQLLRFLTFACDDLEEREKVTYVCPYSHALGALRDSSPSKKSLRN